MVVRQSEVINQLPTTMQVVCICIKLDASDVRLSGSGRVKYTYSGTSLYRTLNKGHLSNEDTVCSPNHIELCTNLPLN